MARLVRIAVTPLKGTALLHPERIALTTDGIPGNRRFLLSSPDGRQVGVFDHGPLVRVRSDLDPSGELRCTFPDGSVVRAHQDDVGAAIEVTLDEHTAPGRILGGPLAEALSTYLGREVIVVQADRDVDGCDVEPVTLVSTASVEALSAMAGAPGLDARRFRMNLQIDGVDAFAEDTWEGGEVSIGEAVLRIGGQVPRCRVTNQDPDTGEPDFPTLRAIAQHRPRMDDGSLPFGMYARVLVPGTVAVGDEIVPPAAA